MEQCVARASLVRPVWAENLYRLALPNTCKQNLDHLVFTRVTRVIDLELIEQIGREREAGVLRWVAERIDIHHHHHPAGIVWIGEQKDICNVALGNSIYLRCFAMIRSPQRRSPASHKNE